MSTTANQITDLSEGTHPQGLTAHLVDRGQKRHRVRMPVEHGDHRCGPLGGKDLIEDPGRRLAETVAALQGAVEQVWARHTHDFDVDTHVGQPIGSLNGLGEQGAHRHDAHRRRGTVTQRVRPGNHLAAAPLAGRGIGGDAGQFLLDRPSGQPQIGRRAVGATQTAEAIQQNPFDLGGEGWFVADAAGLFEADGRRLDGLVRTTFGSQRDPGRGAYQNGLAAGVDTERPRLERPLDERVIEDADRKQWLTPPTPGGS